MSPRDYRATNDCWMPGPDGERLLMLPPPWQALRSKLGVWGGQFLALLYSELLKPVILELNQ